ncbi:hypothetical protein F441_15824 [Phytophthora nicotianae CJ01A1]|uniref:Protein kinase domain-containing protein n=1 Tax=Phytophthora nicotianae CJ01A1 TaxID=1317063 RepID=W2WDE3_PHYNI|nr:hypothetical protein F441_15824 [Phytophthora nicotianae CJ01A1]
MTAGVGTMLWMAPEVMMAKHYDEKADIFSFGVILSELDLQSLPYAHARYDPVSGKKAPDAVVIQKVASDELQVAFSPDCSVAGAAGERVRLARPIGSTIRPDSCFQVANYHKEILRTLTAIVICAMDKQSDAALTHCTNSYPRFANNHVITLSAFYKDDWQLFINQ